MPEFRNDPGYRSFVKRYASEENSAIRMDDELPTTRIGRWRKSVGEFISRPQRATKKIVAEIIGRWELVRPLWNARILLNEDRSYQDIKFWDYFRYSKVPGYELSSLYCKPIGQTLTAYIIGDGISASLSAHAVVTDEELNDTAPKTKAKKSINSTKNAATSIDPEDRIGYTNAAIRRMMENNQSFFQQLFYDTMCLGDQYVVVNPDCTFSVPSPETVQVQHATSDYRKPIRYLITTKLEGAIVEDEYTLEKRTLKITYYDKNTPPLIQEFENLTGRIPIIHFSWERALNEIYGHSIFEPLLPFFRRYDDLLTKTIDGVELIGNPIPVFENLENPDETIKRMTDTETYTDWQGTTQTRPVIRMDRNGVLFLGKGGKASMLSPLVGFTQDSINVLKALQLLMYHATRLPEFLLGGAVASSKASVETQMPPFVQWIEYLRLKLEGRGSDSQLGIQAENGLFALIELWLLQYRILNPAIIVAPVQMEWATIGLENEQMRFQWGQLLTEIGYISPEDTIAMSGEFDDPASTYAKATGGTVINPQFIDIDALLDQEMLDSMQADSNLDKRDDMDAPPDDSWFSMNSASDSARRVLPPPKMNKKGKIKPFGIKDAANINKFKIAGDANLFPPP